MSNPRSDFAKQLSPPAAARVQRWLTEAQFAAYAAEVQTLIDRAAWPELEDAFCTIIPFGTGGRRGRMFPVGTNVINERTIGESAQGLAEYVQAFLAQQASATTTAAPPACVVAYDTRRRSREFAELSAEVMAAAGFTVYFFDGYRSTPELSFAVRFLKCACGIMITASHNPPSDNGFKAYWSTGGQILPPHDAGIIACVLNVERIERIPFATALAAGKVRFCQDEVDRTFVAAVAAQAFAGPRAVKVLYSPLHGVGATAVLPVLAADGFTDVECFAPHAEPNGDFPNVPGHVSNPENPRIFDDLIVRAAELGADVALATDPDCDRLGLAAPLTTRRGAPWQTMTGNQIAALLTDFVLERRQAAGALSAEHYVVKTMVTTPMMRRIADHYGVQTYGNLPVGFKWIGDEIDRAGPARFVFGGEESHGYLVGDYARDKDAAVAAMLIAELTAQLKAARQTLHEKLDSLYWQFGCHAEDLVNVQLPGAAGLAEMQSLMAQLRSEPPAELGGLAVVQLRDYANQTLVRLGAAGAASAAGKVESLSGEYAGPPCEMLFLDLARPGTSVAVRPSGTEPKIKFYTFAFEPAENLHDLAASKAELAALLARLADDLRRLASI